jgi:hypothetical protein
MTRLSSKTDGKLDGFRVHFSNGSSARFHRAPAGVDLMNVVIQKDGTINFMVGLLDALQDRYMVDGKEVYFGDKQSVESFESRPKKYRVVRHTFNAQGVLAERAVMSGSHATYDEAKTSLQKESSRHPRQKPHPESESCEITDKFGKNHVLLIEDALA